MTHPLISVVIPTYNHAAFVADAVESALQQTYRPVEILVVDDGSTDDTRRVLQRYASGIRYLYQPNRGAAAARNLGIERATGELIAFLDADDRWLPDKLAAQVAHFATRPEAALVHTDSFLWDARRGVCERRPRSHSKEFDGRCYARLFWSCGICTSSVVVRRDSLEDVGVFDETIHGASAEDHDLWWRLARRFEFAYIDTPLVLYRVRPTEETRTAVRLQDEVRVIQKRLREDPELRTLIGRRGIRERLFRIWCDMGYLRLDAGELQEARRAFGHAVWQRPEMLYLWGLWLGLLLPPRAVLPLRRAKQRLAERTRPASSGREATGRSASGAGPNADPPPACGGGREAGDRPPPAGDGR